jgi:uncharacterized protein (TIGR02284 family)
MNDKYDKHGTSVLNGLITTTLDSVKGFEDAAEDAKDTRFADLFAGFARDRRQLAVSLQAEVRRLGGKPEDSASFLGAAHRSFMDLKQSLTGKNDKAVVEEVERGEDHLKAKFEEALMDADLQSATLAVIREGFTSVKAGHDQTSALKHSLV